MTESNSSEYFAEHHDRPVVDETDRALAAQGYEAAPAGVDFGLDAEASGPRFTRLPDSVPASCVDLAASDDPMDRAGAELSVHSWPAVWLDDAKRIRDEAVAAAFEHGRRDGQLIAVTEQAEHLARMAVEHLLVRLLTALSAQVTDAGIVVPATGGDLIDLSTREQHLLAHILEDHQ